MMTAVVFPLTDFEKLKLYPVRPSSTRPSSVKLLKTPAVAAAKRYIRTLRTAAVAGEKRAVAGDT